MALESILEINAAIRRQKVHSQDIFPSIVGNILKKEDNVSDISLKLKDPKGPKRDFSLDKELVPKAGKVFYSPFKAFSEYLSGIKTQSYDYYSSAKKEIKKSAKNLGYKILTEIEDWGVVYYKTTFQKMARLTPMGEMTRYLEKLWICVTKHVKY